MIRRVALAAGALLVPTVSGRLLTGKAVSRLLAAPRFGPDEGRLRDQLDALGGEVVRLRSRDGLRLSARWLPAERPDGAEDWQADPHEAILLLHGYSGSVAPDVVEYGPFLRRTAGVLGLDFRGHGGTDDAPTTFGMREVEDVAGALAWLGERGITRVALFGTSMGGMTALASVAVLGDGGLPSADLDPNTPQALAPAPRPLIVGVVGDSVGPEIAAIVANRISGPARRFVADRVLDGVARRLGADPRATEPIRVAALIETVPVLLIRGDADLTVPPADAERLRAALGPSVESWSVPNAGHSAAHSVTPVEYEARVTAFLRHALAEARSRTPIIAGATPQDPSDVAS